MLSLPPIKFDLDPVDRAVVDKAWRFSPDSASFVVTDNI
jgi:hypothetical protein